MKYLFLIIIGCHIFSCTKSENCETIDFNEEFVASLGEDFCFEDGSSFEIKQVKDGICPCNTTCVFEGYVSFEIELIVDNKVIKGELSHDQILQSSAPDLPDNYKIEITDQIPASNDICGGSTNIKDFKWRLSILKK